MKTKTIKLTVDLPASADTIVVGLDLETCSPELAVAQRAESEATTRLAKARDDLKAAITDSERIAPDVSRGRATPAQLEDALRRKQAKALLIPQYEAALAEAQAAGTRAHEAACQRLRDEALRRNRVLEQAAADVAPILDRIKEAERALELHVTKLLGRGGLPPAVWPSCLLHDTHGA